MKKQLHFISTLFLIALLSTNTFSQTMGNLWGLMSYSGDSLGGTILKYNTTSNNDSVVYAFSKDGNYPNYGKLVKANDGNLYGTTSSGGKKGVGTIYTCNHNTKSYKIIYHFEDTLKGKQPRAGLIQASNDTLYGMTSSGGANGVGTIYKCSLDGDASALYSFDDSNNDGNKPYGQLIEYNDTLYGLTTNGGSFGKGTLFKISFSGTYTKLHDFGNGTDGAEPWGSLLYHNNALYGTTSLGGNNNLGMIFKYDLITMQESEVASFIVSTGSNPKGSLIVVNDTLYGTTSLRGPVYNVGTIIKCSFDGNLTAIDHFNGANGGTPNGDLILINDILYGTSPLNTGNIFKCALNGNLTSHFDFTNTNGQGPIGSLIAINDTLYGFTSGGGASSVGVLFSSTASGNLTVLHEFGSYGIGNNPFSSLFQASDGNMYGMNYSGGDFGFGSIFKATPNGNVSAIYHFKNLADGRPGYGSLIEVNDTLYGITTYGGDYDYGTIFKCSFDGHHQVIYSFGSNPNDGSNPYGNLLAVHDTLYGTTYFGGDNGDGVIFKCSLSGTYFFINSLGGSPGMPRNSTGGFTLINDTLYGLAQNGGDSDKGCIYKCSLDGNIQTLHSFGVNANDGYWPFVNLVYAHDGNLYGTTSAGGINNLGTIFKCSLGGAESIVYDFTSSYGIYPSSGLIQASDSCLYGITGWFNNINNGAMFKCSLNGDYTNLVSFNDTTGYSGQPSGNLLEYITVDISKTLNCIGDSLVANVIGGGVGYRYTWSNGETTQKIKITASGNYTVKVTKSDGVIADKMVYANYFSPLVVSAGNMDSICYGMSTQITASASGGDDLYTYNWIPGNLSGNNQSVNPVSTTIFTVTVTDGNGCSSSDSVKIKVNPAISVSTSSSDTICIGTSANISANASGGAGTFTYNWLPGDLSGEIQTVSPTSSTVYTLTVTDIWDCAAVDSLVVTVDLCASVEDILQGSKFNIQVYPNPTTEEFTIELPENSQVIIINELGKEVLNSRYIAGKHTINMREFSSGIYFARITSNNDQTTKRLILTR